MDKNKMKKILKGRIKMKSWKAIKDIFIGGINYEKEDYR